MLLERCIAAKIAKITRADTRPIRKFKPLPLTTIEMQKVLSRTRRMGAKEVLDAAEALYNVGLISYPRTETDKFPAQGFDLQPLIQNQQGSQAWGEYATSLLTQGKFAQPRAGINDDKAHPPIHPTKCVELNGIADAAQRKVYEFVVRRFLACCSMDAIGESAKVVAQLAEEEFTLSGLTVRERNFLDVYPYERWITKAIPAFEEGMTFVPSRLDILDGRTSAPLRLAQDEVIALMDKHGIGTDATMAQHIESIIHRQYVSEVETAGRKRLVSTSLGRALIQSYETLNIHLGKPDKRAAMERDCLAICGGQKQRQHVINECMGGMKQLYDLVIRNKAQWEQSYESVMLEGGENVPDGRGGRVVVARFSQCGSCRRQMQFKEDTGERFLWCEPCNRRLALPRNGNPRASNITCPICQFQVLEMENQTTGKKHHLCPHCFNYSPTDIENVPERGMRCFECPHRTCKLAKGETIVVAKKCPECRSAPMHVRKTQAGKIMANCTSSSCKHAIFMPTEVEKVAATSISCTKCKRYLKLLVTLRRGSVPPGTEMKTPRCPGCDSLFVEYNSGDKKYLALCRERARERNRGGSSSGSGSGSGGQQRAARRHGTVLRRQARVPAKENRNAQRMPSGLHHPGKAIAAGKSIRCSLCLQVGHKARHCPQHRSR